MNRNAAIGSGFAVLLVGLLVGFLAGRRSQSPSDEPFKRAPESSGREITKPVVGSRSVPRSEAKAAHAENARLRQRINDLEARLSSVPPTEEEAHKAEEIYKQLRNPRINEDPKGFMRATGLLSGTHL